MDTTYLSTLVHTIIGMVLIGAIAGVWIHYLWRHALFVWLIFWARIPVIGTNARVATAPGARNPETPDSLITRGEIAWVGRWLPFIAPRHNEQKFKNAAAYIKKAQDADTHTHEAPILRSIVILLVAVDAFLASRILGPHLMGDLPQWQLDAACIVSGVVIGIVIGGFSHLGGALWRRARISSIQRRDHADAMVGVLNPRQIALDDDQSIDDAAPASEHFGGRARLVSHVPAIVLVGIALAIVVLTVGLRFQNFAEENAQAQAHAAQMAQERAEQGPVGSVVEAVTEGIKWSADMIATALFGLIGAATVLVGAVGGYRHGFNGHETKKAHKITQGYGTYDQMEEARFERIAAVQVCFAHFQSLLGARRTHQPALETVMRLLIARRDNKTPAPPSDPKTGGVISIVPQTTRDAPKEHAKEKELS